MDAVLGIAARQLGAIPYRAAIAGGTLVIFLVGSCSKSTESAGGGTGGSGGAAGFGGGSACVSDEECRERGLVCNTYTKVCAECEGYYNCADGEDCENGKCKAFIPCGGSLDCPEKLTCDPDLGRCFKCVSDIDCSDGEHCAQNTCHLACVSEGECRSIDQLCEQDLEICVECLTEGDCPEGKNCNANNCVENVCRPGSTACAGNSVVTCMDGLGYGPETPCTGNTGCHEENGDAKCRDLSSGGSGGRGGDDGAGGTGDAGTGVSGSGGSGGCATECSGGFQENEWRCFDDEMSVELCEDADETGALDGCLAWSSPAVCVDVNGSTIACVNGDCFCNPAAGDVCEGTGGADGARGIGTGGTAGMAGQAGRL